MYYQLTMQFGTDEIEDAKKVLELAKELDLKRAGLQELTIPRAKDWVPMDEPTPEPVKPMPKPDPTAEPITVKDLQKAGVAFAKEKGMAVLKVFLTQMGASKISDIPKEKYQEAWEALHA